MEFTEKQVERYARHIVLQEIGGVGQAKLLDASVLVVGAGCAGVCAAIEAAGAGAKVRVLERAGGAGSR